MNDINTTLIKGGAAVLGDTVLRCDILIRGEKISAVGELGGADADRVVDASGLLVIPGGVDTHVHFNDSFMNTVSVHEFETGTRAAAFGGVTSVIDFSNQEKGGSLLSCIERKKDEAGCRA